MFCRVRVESVSVGSVSVESVESRQGRERETPSGLVGMKLISTRKLAIVFLARTMDDDVPLGS